MKLLLVASDERHRGLLGFHLRPLGFAIEHLADPVQAVDRLQEIDPQAVLFHAGDFPRHWKAALKVARQKRSREELVFILIAPPDFEMEEAAKAVFLGANGIIGTDLARKETLYRLEELVRRYRPVTDKRAVTRVVAAEEERFAFALTHPRRLAMVVGRIREISVNGASFLPSAASAVAGIEAGSELQRCALKVGGGIVTLGARVTRNREELGLQFLSFEGDGRSRLLAWIESRSQRALAEAIAAGPPAPPVVPLPTPAP